MATTTATDGLHRDLTVRRQPLVLEAPSHDVRPASGGTVKGLVRAPETAPPPNQGVIARQVAPPHRAGASVDTDPVMIPAAADDTDGAAQATDAAIAPTPPTAAAPTPPSNGPVLRAAAPSAPGAPTTDAPTRVPTLGSPARDGAAPATAPTPPAPTPAGPVDRSIAIERPHPIAGPATPVTPAATEADTRPDRSPTHPGGTSIDTGVTDTASIDTGVTDTRSPSPASGATQPIVQRRATAIPPAATPASPVTTAPSGPTSGSAGTAPSTRPVAQESSAAAPSPTELDAAASVPSDLPPAPPSAAGPDDTATPDTPTASASAPGSESATAGPAIDRAETPVDRATPAPTSAPPTRPRVTRSKLDGPPLGLRPPTRSSEQADAATPASPAVDRDTAVAPDEQVMRAAEPPTEVARPAPEATHDDPTVTGSDTGSDQPIVAAPLARRSVDPTVAVHRSDDGPASPPPSPTPDSTPQLGLRPPLPTPEQAHQPTVDRAADEVAATRPRSDATGPDSHDPWTGLRADRAVAPAVRRPVDRPIAPRPPHATPDAMPSATPGPADGPVPDGLDLLLQRASMPVDREPVPAMAADATGTMPVDRASFDTGYPPAGTGSTSDDPMDHAELADAIYERVERRLRGELFRDLERRGHLSEWG